MKARLEAARLMTVVSTRTTTTIGIWNIGTIVEPSPEPQMGKGRYVAPKIHDVIWRQA